jgi:rhodanese-related sulfurtransferase
MAAGQAVVIDVRPLDEYRKGHIPGAINLPWQQLAGMWSGREAVRDFLNA